MKDRFSDDRASASVQWLNPADLNLSDDHPDAARMTGWYYKDGAEWVGPFATSAEAAEKQK